MKPGKKLSTRKNLIKNSSRNFQIGISGQYRKQLWPDDDEQLKKKEVRNATNVIRLITRLIFIWFIKEKKLVDDILFMKR